jgi:diacylglycerol O-acyltransferase
VRKLSTLDTLFLSCDTRRYPMDGMGVFVLDPSTAPEPLSFERARTRIRESLANMPPLRRRLVRVPFDIETPYWIEDPGFDLDEHLHHVAVPAPGGRHTLLDLIARVGNQPLDRSRPLWEIWFVEGLAGGHVALLFRIHHACIDGMGGIAMLQEIFDAVPDPPRAAAHVDPWQPDQIPGEASLLLGALPRALSQPVRAFKAMRHVARAILQSRGEGSGEPPPPQPAQRERQRPSFNQVVRGQPHRALAWASVSMDDVNAVREAMDATVNDVALALCAGALRAYLEAHGEPSDGPLTVGNPVNVRAKSETGGFENRVDMMGPRIPIHVPDPIERLRLICVETKSRKSGRRERSENLLEDVFNIFSPGFVGSVVQGFSEAELARFLPIPIPFDLVVTNLQASPDPQYFCGARLEGFFIQMMMLETLGLVISLVSQGGKLHFSVTSIREVLPHPHEVADGVVAELEKLKRGLGLDETVGSDATHQG